MTQDATQKLSKQLLAKLLVVLGVFLLCALSFVAIANQVQSGASLAYDQAILTAVNQQASPFWDGFFTFITQLGGGYAAAIITLVLGGLFIARRNYKKALIVVAGIAGAALINSVLKVMFERARPDLWEHLVTETSYSFPSGHAMMASAIAFTIMAICWPTKYSWASVVVGSIYFVTIGVSRLYLGVHYPTDILAGWLASGAWVLLVVAVVYQNSLLRLLARK